MDETKHTPNPGIGHETSDINVWAIGKFAIGLVAICVISILLLLGLFKFFQSREDTSVATTIQPRAIFPQPQLQQTPVLDLKAIRAEEELYLTTYAWVDQPKGVVRIPIAQAIDILAKRGLPSRPQSAAEIAGSEVSVPTESGLGVKAMHEEPREAAESPAAAEPKPAAPKEGHSK